MTTYLNRWTLALGWLVAMAVLWALFVPRGLSVTTFTLLTATGLVVSFVGFVLLSDSQPPRSVNQILGDLEAEPKAAGPSGRAA